MLYGGKMFKIAICEDDKYQIDINKLLINKWAEKKEISLSKVDPMSRTLKKRG